MARGMAPRPPAGGGRPQPPRRGGQPPKTGKPPPKTGQRPKQGQPAKSGQKAAQTRQVLDQQRKAAAQSAKQGQQQRLRQQTFLREAHGQRRRAEAEQRTAELREQVDRLGRILTDGLQRSAHIDLDSLYQSLPAAQPFDAGPLAEPAPEPSWQEYAPGEGLLLGRLGGKGRRERQEAAAREAFAQAREAWQVAERERQERLAEAERAYHAGLTQRREQVEQYNSRIGRVAAGLRGRESAVVESFLRTVLRRVPLPADFPRRCEVRHDHDREWALLRVVLPGGSVIPLVSGYTYQPQGDQLLEVARPVAEAAELYRLVIAQVALLVVRDVLAAEPALAGVRFEGLVDRLDPTTGEPVFACLLRFAADRADFDRLELAETPAEDCLRQLRAEVSADPYGGQSLGRQPLQPA